MASPTPIKVAPRKVKTPEEAKAAAMKITEKRVTVAAKAIQALTRLPLKKLSPSQRQAVAQALKADAESVAYIIEAGSAEPAFKLPV